MASGKVVNPCDELHIPAREDEDGGQPAGEDFRQKRQAAFQTGEDRIGIGSIRLVETPISVKSARPWTGT